MVKSETFKVKVWGEAACYTRPEMKVERVSYDVMTPSAARGVLEAVLWKPAIRWVITGIDVLKPLSWQSVRRNEVGVVASLPDKKLVATGVGTMSTITIEDSRQQRAGLFLKDVAYVVHAHFEMTPNAGPEDSVVKFSEMFKRRLEKGQCFAQPYLGCREFSAYVAPANEKDVPDASVLGTDYNKELGWMLYDIDFANEMQPMFFKAAIQAGHVDTDPQRVGVSR